MKKLLLGLSILFLGCGDGDGDSVPTEPAETQPWVASYSGTEQFRRETIVPGVSNLVELAMDVTLKQDGSCAVETLSVSETWLLGTLVDVDSAGPQTSMSCTYAIDLTNVTVDVDLTSSSDPSDEELFFFRRNSAEWDGLWWDVQGEPFSVFLERERI